MKRFLLPLLFCLTTRVASAQGTLLPALDNNTLELGRRVVFPAFALFLLGCFVIAAIKLVLNYLLKRQIIASGSDPNIVERLLPRPQDEQNQVVERLVLLLSTGAGLAVCNWYLPLGLHSVIILLFSTALGFLAYYLFLNRRAK
jgi:hypothetical protein